MEKYAFDRRRIENFKEIEKEMKLEEEWKKSRKYVFLIIFGLVALASYLVYVFYEFFSIIFILVLAYLAIYFLWHAMRFIVEGKDYYK